MNTVVLSLNYNARASYYLDWVDAFVSTERLRVRQRDPGAVASNRNLRAELICSDLIVLLHSCTADTLSYVEPLTSLLADRRGKLVVFVGNEFNLPWNGLAKKIEWLSQIEPDIVVTQLLQEAGEWLYGDVSEKVLSLPHALNPAAFNSTVPPRMRPIDVGGRTSRYLPYVGDNDRNEIYEYFLSAAKTYNLNVDLKFNQPMSRSRWARFLSKCKATPSSEAGSRYLDKDDGLVKGLFAEYVKPPPRGTVVLSQKSWAAKVGRKLPHVLRRRLLNCLRIVNVWHEADYGANLPPQNALGHIFTADKVCPVYSKAISSRHFDAIGTRTVQVLFPGRYNDILEPGKHYIQLQRDFSNFDEVVEILKDPEELTRIANSAYELAISKHTHKHRIEKLLRNL